MKTLFSKILLAQVITVILALLVVTILTRVSLNRGFINYLERQETLVLKTLAPALADLHESRGDWSFLKNNPRNWERIWRQTRGVPGDRPGPRNRGRPPADRMVPPGQSPDAQILRWMRSLDRPMLRDRLFLLDESRVRVAGAIIASVDDLNLQAIENDIGVVGWIGFTPMGKVLPPDAQQFLQGQIRLMAISLLIAMGLAAILGYLLARNLSRPVRQLSAAVNQLSDGHYETRARVDTSDEIGRLGKNVNHLAETLEKNRSARQRWMADIAHELRTPVAIMKGEIESIADGVRQADNRSTESLLEEINQLTALVDDLQTLALADAGALNIRKVVVDFTSLVKQSTEPFEHRMADRSIKQEIELEEGVTLSADSHRLRQLLQNLLENSSRYVESGGTVCLKMMRRDGMVDVLLDDSGPGVSDRQLEQLFNRFYRVEGSRSRESGGSGLGLSICKNIAEAHGGEIRAGHSSLGGLSIRISLPEI